ncbi:MAG TPA: vanadium-dependent haloperoxidase [Candidatus Limnocylindria bacterium]|nr:vanadium-dependent haloperoxidase [Candidatus Limnocylindria bacterium]
MTSKWNKPISRRRMLSSAVAGAALFTPIRWLSSPSLAGATLSARPLSAMQYDAAVPTAWFGLVQRLVMRTPGYSPPVASRAFGCLGVGLYESLVPGMPDYVSLAGTLHDLPAIPRSAGTYHWPSVANATLASMTRNLFPTAPEALRAEIDQLEAQMAGNVAPGILRRSVEAGRAAAGAVDAWSRSDGGHEGYLRNFPADYVPPVGEGLWVPTPPGFQRAMQPRWGSNRAMALDTALTCNPGPPPPFSTQADSAFLAEALEVYETVNGLTSAQRDIALFWSDDPGLTATPPGHSVSILGQVLRTQDRSLADAAVAYARLGIAVCDAFIACWRVKYIHNLLRPISFIRSHIDPTWDALPLTTPPFPEYTSGHSVQSAAAAEVMKATLGETAFTDHTHDARGLAPRSFGSFAEFAQEAAISRLYGGIHFRSAIERGLEQGRCIGSAVAAIPLQR